MAGTRLGPDGRGECDSLRSSQDGDEEHLSSVEVKHFLAGQPLPHLGVSSRCLSMPRQQPRAPLDLRRLVAPRGPQQQAGARSFGRSFGRSLCSAGRKRHPAAQLGSDALGETVTRLVRHSVAAFSCSSAGPARPAPKPSWGRSLREAGATKTET